MKHFNRWFPWFFGLCFVLALAGMAFSVYVVLEGLDIARDAVQQVED